MDLAIQAPAALGTRMDRLHTPTSLTTPPTTPALNTLCLTCTHMHARTHTYAHTHTRTRTRLAPRGAPWDMVPLFFSLLYPLPSISPWHGRKRVGRGHSLSPLDPIRRVMRSAREEE